HARRDADFAVEFAGIPDSPDVGYRPESGARPVMAGTLPRPARCRLCGGVCRHTGQPGRRLQA
ncbi:hypothetical protein CKJ90_32760, partial [Klebsiella pneumoniae]